MGEIHVYPVYRGVARKNNNGGITIGFHYDAIREPFFTNIQSSPGFGLNFYNDMIEKGYAEAATRENPGRSPSAGVLYILDNGKFFSNRRDKKAKTHPLHHSLQIGYSSCKRQTKSPEEIMVAEGAELVLVTKEKPHSVIMPKGDPVARAINMDAAVRIGIDTSRIVEADFEYEGGPDEVRLYEDDNLISSTKGYVVLFWDIVTALNILQKCYIKFDPENILPIDTEGWFEDDIYKHLNRETFLFDPLELKNKRFGDRLETPTVYKSEMVEEVRVPFLQAEEPKDAPYVFMPDDNLTRMMYGLGIWDGDWLEHFKKFHEEAIQKIKGEKK